MKLLDTVAIKTVTGKLETKLHTKGSDLQSYLLRKFESLRRNISFAQIFWLGYICTADKEF